MYWEILIINLEVVLQAYKDFYSDIKLGKVGEFVKAYKFIRAV